MVVKSNLLSYIAQAIYDKKGFNILALDIRKNAFLYDYVIIAEGSADVHVKALAKFVLEQMKKKKQKPILVEGMEHGEWVILDYGDIAVHLFLKEIREKYCLEEIWNKGKIVNLKINTKKSKRIKKK